MPWWFMDLIYTAEIAAILLRILRVADGSNKPTRLHYACRILVESGGLFTATTILNLIPNILRHSYLAVITDAVVSNLHSTNPH